MDANALMREFDPSVIIASPTQVRQEAQARSSNVFSNYINLREILMRHEATIQKRWIKKTKQQKQKILLDAWPDMAVTHRPDFDAIWRTGNSHGGKSGGKFRDYCLLPQINQEDLLKPKTLLLLLNARGRNSPPEFASADIEAMHLGIVTKSIRPIFLNEHTMALNGAHNASEYGKLWEWDEHPDAFDWMHTQKQFHPGEGLLVLEAQEKLMRFLVTCCQYILHDIPADNLIADTFPVQPEPHLKTGKETNGFDSLAVMAAEAPYRLPARLDLGRIESVLGARLSAAEDHLWAMREDPAYFLEQLIETKEHRQELLKDTYGDEHPVFRTAHQKTFWARVYGSVAFESYLQLEVFSELYQQAQALKLLQMKYAAVISPTEDLPEELMNAILKFRHYLIQTAKGPPGGLRDGLVASPPWRKYFVRHPPPNSTSTKLSVYEKPGVKMGILERQLLWILRTLWEDGHDLFLVSLPLIVDELGRLLETEPRAQELVSQKMTGFIGDLAIITHCISQLDLYQPWARTFETTLVDLSDDIESDYKKRTEPWAMMMEALRDINLVQVAQIGNPSDRRFAYPYEKRRTKQNVEELRRAEQHLDQFWVAIDRIVNTKCGSLKGTAVHRVLSQPRMLQRTPDWIDPPPSTTKAQSREPTLDPSIADLYKPLSTIYIGEVAGAAGNKAEALTPKTKAKTRDASSNAATGTATVVIDEDPKPEPISIPVNARSLKVFRTLFFNPAKMSSPGEILWNDFLYAMTSSGLFTAEKLYGSVWQFQKLEGEQSRIQFHEPHPRGKMPFTIARRYGRRLNRAFGWGGDTFVLDEK
ncbi:hypothetical protein F5Y00DRAFT_222564 [Daldinia vernicosa]|uniref:uncharacterized protein n=1 Tax=Daldinia vernicosa TaxID=114800 RepID=UPI0020089AF1|nr:uncharacterized protein F5Y00DRAFT_222564 [Daldinia vernicosa]KAI0854223.1 hypothetical protein F5Y00DRAFT_222564 [Daldinia vernicosa]